MLSHRYMHGRRGKRLRPYTWTLVHYPFSGPTPLPLFGDRSLGNRSSFVDNHKWIWCISVWKSVCICPLPIFSAVTLFSVNSNSRKLNAFNEWLEENDQALSLERWQFGGWLEQPNGYLPPTWAPEHRFPHKHAWLNSLKGMLNSLVILLL